MSFITCYAPWLNDSGDADEALTSRWSSGFLHRATCKYLDIATPCDRLTQINFALYQDLQDLDADKALHSCHPSGAALVVAPRRRGILKPPKFLQQPARVDPRVYTVAAPHWLPYTRLQHPVSAIGSVFHTSGCIATHAWESFSQGDIDMEKSKGLLRRPACHCRLPSCAQVVYLRHGWPTSSSYVRCRSFGIASHHLSCCHQPFPS